MQEIEIENIEDVETIECIKVFDEELNILLNKTPECGSVDIDKFIKTTEPAKIRMEFTSHGKRTGLEFAPDFFEDYCFSNRKERNNLLKNAIEDIKDKMAKL
jgi:hypothetical protein